MLISSNSVFATTTAEYDEQIESIKSQQAENEAEAERLNEKLDSLRDQTSEAEAYQATLEEQITTYQTSIDLAVQNITQLNTNITNLEAEIKKADEEYADTFAELKVRLRSLYASGGNLTTLQILFDSTSLYDFSMRSEAMKTITKHDRELMEKIRLYRIQTQDQRDELNKEKEELADQKKDIEKKQEEIAGARGRKPEAHRRAEYPEQRDGKRFGGGRGGEGRLRFRSLTSLSRPKRAGRKGRGSTPSGRSEPECREQQLRQRQHVFRLG